MGMQTTSSQRGRPRSGTQRQQEIVEKLESIFLRAGFRATTIDELSSRLSCSKKTLYNIAPSKEEIFLLVMDTWLQRIKRTGSEAAAISSSPRERIEAFLKPGIEQTVNTTQAFWADVESYRPAKAMLSIHQRERMHAIEEMIQAGIDEGNFHKVHPYLISEVLLSAILRFDSPEFLELSGLTMGEAFRELYDVVFRGIDVSTGTAKK